MSMQTVVLSKSTPFFCSILRAFWMCHFCPCDNALSRLVDTGTQSSGSKMESMSGWGTIGEGHSKGCLTQSKRWPTIYTRGRVCAKLKSRESMTRKSTRYPQDLSISTISSKHFLCTWFHNLFREDKIDLPSNLHPWELAR